MTKYKCNICGSEVVESSTVPSFCPGCAASNGPWINQTTMKEEQVKIAAKSISPGPSTFIKKKKITPSPKAGSASPGKPPVYTPPVTPPSSFYSSPYYSPPPAPVYSPPPYSAPDTFIKRIFNSINTIKYLPAIISLVIVAISLGRVLLYPLKLLVAGLILLLTKYFVFKIFNLSKYDYPLAPKVIAIPFILFALSLPVGLFNGTSDLFQLASEAFKNLTKSKNVEAPKPPDTFYLVKNMNIYQQPSNDATPITTIQNLEQLNFTGNISGDWIEINYSGQTGWISNTPSLFATDPSEIRLCLISGMQKVNLRSGPSKNKSILGVVKKNEVVRFLSLSPNKKWVKIKDSGGNNGWLWREYINPVQ